LGICSFWKCNMAPFWAKNEPFGKLLIFCPFWLFRSFQKSERAIAIFVAFFERVKEQLLFLSLFLKEQKSYCSFGCSFEKSKKRAIAHLLFCKERRKEQLLIRSFAKSNKKSDCSFVLFKRANEQAIAQSLFWKEQNWAMSKWAHEQLPNPAVLSICSFWNERLLFLKEQKKSNCSFALLQRATKRVIAHSLFCKEWRKEWLLIRSF